LIQFLTLTVLGPEQTVRADQVINELPNWPIV